MAHADICPCKHGNHVCLLPCRECFPNAAQASENDIRAEYHALAVKHEAVATDAERLQAHIAAHNAITRGDMPFDVADAVLEAAARSRQEKKGKS